MLRDAAARACCGFFFGRTSPDCMRQGRVASGVFVKTASR